MSLNKRKKTRQPKLSPDPDGMNDERSDWAEAALTAFRERTGANPGDAVCDLIADLGHYCDRNGLVFSAQVRRGLWHYQEETERNSPVL